MTALVSEVTDLFDGWASDGQDEDMERSHGGTVRVALGRMGLRKGETVLDLGCGNGWATRLIASITEGRCVGIDGAPNMVKHARKFSTGRDDVTFEQARFEDLPFEDALFDRVFSMEAIYYADDLPGVAGEIRRILKPGGHAEILVNFYTENRPTETWPEKLGLRMQRLSEPEWRCQFEDAGFVHLASERVVSPEKGTEDDFRPSEWCPTWREHVEFVDNGTLWIRAAKPA